MINQAFAHMWRSAFSVLSPVCLIDRILDWVDELGAAILPVQDNARACQLADIEVLD